MINLNLSTKFEVSIPVCYVMKTANAVQNVENAVVLVIRGN